MHNPFELSGAEKASATCPQQLEMFERLVAFVNERLHEIQALETKVENLENTNSKSND